MVYIFIFVKGIFLSMKETVKDKFLKLSLATTNYCKSTAPSKYFILCHYKSVYKIGTSDVDYQC